MSDAQTNDSRAEAARYDRRQAIIRQAKLIAFPAEPPPGNANAPCDFEPEKHDIRICSLVIDAIETISYVRAHKKAMRDAANQFIESSLNNSRKQE